MAILGAFCFPGTGHLNPFTALARRLQERGHRVIIFGIADTEARVRAAGVEFQRVGCEDYPLGTLKQLDDKLSRLKGLESFASPLNASGATPAWCCAMDRLPSKLPGLRRSWSMRQTWPEASASTWGCLLSPLHAFRP